MTSLAFFVGVVALIKKLRRKFLGSRFSSMTFTCEWITLRYWNYRKKNMRYEKVVAKLPGRQVKLVVARASKDHKS